MAIKHKYVQREVLPSGSIRWRVEKRINGKKVRALLKFAPGQEGFAADYANAIETLHQKARQPDENVEPKVFPQSTVGWLVGKFMADLERQVNANLKSPDTLKRYQLHLGRLMSHRYTSERAPDGVPVRDLHMELTRAVIVQARDVYLSKPSSAQGLVKTVKAFYAWVIEEAVYGIEQNPAANIKTVAPVTDGHRIWTSGEVSQYLAHHKEGTLPRLAMVMVLCTAARRGDLVRFGPKHVKDNWLNWKQEKGGASVEIPVIKMLRDELARHEPHGETFLGIGPNKVERSKKSFGGDFSTWRASAGLPDGLSLHGVRKGVASILTEFGLSTYMIDVILGHEIGSAATKVYTRGAERRKLAEEANTEWETISWH